MNYKKINWSEKSDNLDFKKHILKKKKKNNKNKIGISESQLGCNRN